MATQFKNPFVCVFTPFARHSVTFDQNVSLEKNILVGDAKSTTFCEIMFDEKDRRPNKPLVFASYTKHFNKTNANLQKAGFLKCGNAKNCQSHLIKQGKYIVIIDPKRGYNVFDIENNVWLLEKSNKNIDLSSVHFRSLIINDEIIIISNYEYVYFYSISIANNNFTNPKLVKKYKIVTPNLSYSVHGMCCLDLKETQQGIRKYINTLDNFKTQNNTHNSTTAYDCKLILFGGTHGGGHHRFLFDTFLLLDINVSNIDNSYSMDITEKVIDFETNSYLSNKKDDNNSNNNSSSKWLNIDPNSKFYEDFMSFGYECVYNSKQEPIIVIIGGIDLIRRGATGSADDPNKCVITCNLVTRKVVRYSRVELI